jgi:hypothetical protein
MEGLRNMRWKLISFFLKFGIKIKILQIRIYYFVIHSLLFGMKFCKNNPMQVEDDLHAPLD